MKKELESDTILSFSELKQKYHGKEVESGWLFFNSKKSLFINYNKNSELVENKGDMKFDGALGEWTMGNLLFSGEFTLVDDGIKLTSKTIIVYPEP